MGKGDIKSKRGKISSSSYGNARPKPGKIAKAKAAKLAKANKAEKKD